MPNITSIIFFMFMTESQSDLYIASPDNPNNQIHREANWKNSTNVLYFFLTLSIKTVKSVLGSKPHKATAIQNGAVDCILGEAVICGVMAKT